MAARVCSSCELNFPCGKDHLQCLACGKPTAYSSFHQVRSNWEAKAIRIKGILEADGDQDSEPARVTAWRVARLKRMGVEHDLAADLANRTEDGAIIVDLHRFEELIDRGWTPNQVVEVLG